jgi:hypothetical protein
MPRPAGDIKTNMCDSGKTFAELHGDGAVYIMRGNVRGRNTWSLTVLCAGETIQAATGQRRHTQVKFAT